MVTRLKYRREFLAAARSRRSLGRRGLVLQVRKREPNKNKYDAKLPNGLIRYGLTATKKIGNAVVRNRARRRLRALAEEILPKYAKDGHDYVLICRVTTGRREWLDLRRDLISALKKMKAYDSNKEQG